MEKNKNQDVEMEVINTSSVKKEEEKNEIVVDPFFGKTKSNCLEFKKVCVLLEKASKERDYK